MKALLLVAAMATLAHADTKADKLFAKGKKLLAQKKYEEACKAFEDSDAAETAIGTKLNVARCYEEWGKVATALRWYQDAAKLAKESKDPRVEKIKGLAENIDGDVPRLTIKAPEDAELASLTLDGAATEVNEPLPLDPGPHELKWTNADGKKKNKLVPLEKGGSSEVKVDLPVAPKHKKKKDKDKDKEPEPEPTPVAQRDGHSQRLAGIVVGAGGVVLIGVAAGVTLAARSLYNSALDGHCNGDRTMCDDIGLSKTATARSHANIGTVFALVGVAAVGTGAVLYLIAPHGAKAHVAAEKDTEARSLYLAPEVGPEGGAILLGGTF